MIILKIDISKIKEQQGFNTRYDLGDLQELKQSIISEGLKRQLKCKRVGDDYILTDGHRRFAAMQIALSEGIILPKIKVEVEPDSYTDEKRTLDIILLNQGKPLTLLEEARVYQRGVTEYGWTAFDISKKTGKTKSHIHNLIMLANSDKRIQELVIANKVSALSAVKVIQVYKDNPELQIKELSAAMDDSIKNGGTRINPSNLQIVKDSTYLGKNL